MSLINRYAVLLANIDCSLNVSLYNSRLAHVFEAETDAQVKSLQKCMMMFQEEIPQYS